MGTVKGDRHDIGKNLCIMMLRGTGLHGRSTSASTPPPDDFIEAVEDERPPADGHVGAADDDDAEHGQDDRRVRRRRPARRGEDHGRGAPVTPEFAEDMGADGYGKDAMACVAIAKQLIGVGSALS